MPTPGQVLVGAATRRSPDGVTLLSPYEQYGPDAYPGQLCGDPTQAMTLFDILKLTRPNNATLPTNTLRW